MVLTRALLESFELWFTLEEDVTECRRHMEALDYLIPKFQDFSVVITEEDLTAAKATMHFMECVSKTVTPFHKPEGYPSYSDVDDPENIEVTVRSARASPTPPMLDGPDVL